VTISTLYSNDTTPCACVILMQIETKTVILIKNKLEKRNKKIYQNIQKKKGKYIKGKKEIQKKKKKQFIINNPTIPPNKT